MKCPYCSADLEKGVITSPNEIYWRPQKRLFYDSDDDVCLSPMTLKAFITGTAAAAMLCRNCKKVIIDYTGSSRDSAG